MIFHSYHLIIRRDRTIVAIVERLFTYWRELLLVYPMWNSFLQRNYLVITWCDTILFRENTGESPCKYKHFDINLSIMISINTQDNTHWWGDISVKSFSLERVVSISKYGYTLMQKGLSHKNIISMYTSEYILGRNHNYAILNITWGNIQQRDHTNVAIVEGFSHKNIILMYTSEYILGRNHNYAILNITWGNIQERATQM